MFTDLLYSDGGCSFLTNELITDLYTVFKLMLNVCDSVKVEIWRTECYMSLSGSSSLSENKSLFVCLSPLVICSELVLGWNISAILKVAINALPQLPRHCDDLRGSGGGGGEWGGVGNGMAGDVTTDWGEKKKKCFSRCWDVGVNSPEKCWNHWTTLLHCFPQYQQGSRESDLKNYFAG